MLKIWGRLNSINVQKVVWAATEVGVPFERVDAGGAFGIVKTPDYLAKNPNALIPVLEDGDDVFWESNAIVRYLAARYGSGSLWPVDPVARAHSDKWMDWASTALYPAFAPAFMNLIRTPIEQRDAAAIESARAKAEGLVAVLDEHLATRTFVGGETFTMGDICAGAGIHRWLNLPLSREKRPNVERWYGMIRTRPGAVAALLSPLT